MGFHLPEETNYSSHCGNMTKLQYSLLRRKTTGTCANANPACYDQPAHVQAGHNLQGLLRRLDIPCRACCPHPTKKVITRLDMLEGLVDEKICGSSVSSFLTNILFSPNKAYHIFFLQCSG